MTPPRVESPGCLGDLPLEGPQSRFNVEVRWFRYDALQWSSYAKFREARRLEAEMEELVDTLVDTHLVSPNLPE